MATRRQFALDIMNQLGYDHDDAARSLVAVMYNVNVCADKLLADSTKRDLSLGDQLSSQEDMSIWTVDLLTDVNRGMRYFDLPGSVYSLPNGRGIQAIRYYRLGLPDNCPPQIARVEYRQVSLSWLTSIWNARWQYVDASQPVFARARAGSADRVYVLGQDEAITQLEAQLYLAMPALVDLDPDEEMPFPANRMHTLKRMVIELERWALMVPQQRLKNDGRDFEPGQVVRTEPLVGRNDQVNIDD